MKRDIIGSKQMMNNGSKFAAIVVLVIPFYPFILFKKYKAFSVTMDRRLGSSDYELLKSGILRN